MDLLQLRYFCHAAATQNFSKTAADFHVPPSNISHCIRRLEEEHGKPLFDRTCNRVELNNDGELFYQKIQEALNLIDDAVHTLTNTKECTPIRVGLNINRRTVTRAFNKFYQKYPKIEVMMTNFGETTRLEDYDLIITDRYLDSTRFVRKHILRDKIVLITPKNYLTPGSTITPEEMQSFPFITITEGSVMYRNTIDICKQFDITPHIAIQSDSSLYIPTFVEQGMGVAFAPSKAWAWCLSGKNIDFKDIGDFYRNTYVYTKKERFPSESVKLFYEILLQEYASEYGLYQE